MTTPPTPDPAPEERADSSDAPAESPALAELYRGLAHAHMAGEDLQEQLRGHVTELEQAEQQLQAERAEYEDQGDQEATRRIDDQLDQVGHAMRVAKEQLDDQDATAR